MRLRFALLIVAAPLALGGCDTGGNPAAQASGDSADVSSAGRNMNSAAAPPDPAGDEILTAPDGTRATLTRRHAGTAMPTAILTSLTGAPATLAEMADGRPLLVNLWATWCVPCVTELPSLDRLAGRLDGQAMVVPVSQDMGGAREVAPWFAARGFQRLTTLIDADLQMMAAMGGGAALPTTILYDGAGREIWRVVGGAEWDRPDMAARIDAAL